MAYKATAHFGGANSPPGTGRCEPSVSCYYKDRRQQNDSLIKLTVYNSSSIYKSSSPLYPIQQSVNYNAKCLSLCINNTHSNVKPGSGNAAVLSGSNANFKNISRFHIILQRKGKHYRRFLTLVSPLDTQKGRPV